MEQNVKQVSNFLWIYYWIRRFDITAIVFKDPKLQEILNIKPFTLASFFWNYKLYTVLLSQIYAQISSRARAECAASFHFLYAFVLLNKTFRQYMYHVCFNDPKLKEAIKITASSPPSPTPSTPVFRNITYYIYSKFHNDMLPSQAMKDQYVKQDSDFPMHFYGLRQFKITTFVCKAPKLEGAVKRTASGSRPFIWKYYKLYIGLISERYGLILDQLLIFPMHFY